MLSAEEAADSDELASAFSLEAAESLSVNCELEDDSSPLSAEEAAASDELASEFDVSESA